MIHSPGFSNGTLCGLSGPAFVDGVTCESCLFYLGKAKAPHIGDYVAVPYNSGISSTTVYGVVTARGPRTFTVLWESGRRNRLKFDNQHCVTRVTDVDATALRRLTALQQGEDQGAGPNLA